MKHTAGVILRTLILLLIGIALGIFITDNRQRHRFFGANEVDDKISKVLDIVRSNYVDSVNTDSIAGVAVNDMLQNLDPHSVYLPAQQARSISERLGGGFDGIGLEYQLLRDTLVITQVYSGGPAERAGLNIGEKVLSVNNVPFSGTRLTLSRVSKTFRGEKESEIKLGVLTADGKRKNVSIRRGHVTLSSLDAAYCIGDAGYIKISKFASTTDEDFRKALAELKTEGIKKLVIDLRGNGGGYLNAATSLADEFLTKDKLIVYTKGLHEPRTDYFATDSGSYQDGKLTIIIDEYSASASEILAGALQDLDRATIVGRRSFGKGLVQQQFPFNDGTAVNLTVARYYTPSGRSIQKSYKHGLQSYHNELSERVKKGELLSADNSLADSAFIGAPTFHTRKGRKVLSAGGIMPDVFVPADTTREDPLIVTLINKQIFSAYVIDTMQQQLKKYPTADAFIAQYKVGDEDLQKFLAYARQSEETIGLYDTRCCVKTLSTLLKAHAARFRWGNNAYYRVLNSNDETFRKAVAI